MKDEDVYIMNVGDSRAILACKRSNQGSFSRTSKASTTDSGMTSLDNSQQTCHELDEFSTVSGDRDVSMKLELEKIIEETTIELEAFETVNDIVSCVLLSPATSSSSLNALQLSKDHTTSNDQVEREPWFVFYAFLHLICVQLEQVLAMGCIVVRFLSGPI